MYNLCFQNKKDIYNKLVKEASSGFMKLEPIFYSTNKNLITGDFTGIFRVEGILYNCRSLSLAGRTDKNTFVSVRIPKRPELIDYDLSYLAFYEGLIRKPTHEEKKLLKAWNKREIELSRFECSFDEISRQRKKFFMQRGNHSLFKSVLPYRINQVIDYKVRGDLYFKAVVKHNI